MNELKPCVYRRPENETCGCREGAMLCPGDCHERDVRDGLVEAVRGPYDPKTGKFDARLAMGMSHEPGVVPCRTWTA